MFDEQTMRPISSLPRAFRIVSTSCLPSTQGRGVTYRVDLYHDKACVTVTFSRAHPDIRLCVNQLVSVWWKLPLVSTNGAIPIANLVLLEYPIKGVNLFETVPPRWGRDRELLKRGKELLDLLPLNIQRIVTAILWDSRRFRRFCEQSVSIRARRDHLNDQLRYAVKAGEGVHLLTERYSQDNVGMAEAILNDVGKVVEYEMLG